MHDKVCAVASQQVSEKVVVAGLLVFRSTQ